MEPILFARRQMFHAMATTDASREICLSHLESCRLARRAEHLQTAWSSLVAARQLNVESVAVDMEESRYLFQKVCGQLERATNQMSFTGMPKPGDKHTAQRHSK